MKIDCVIPLYNKKNFILNSVNSALNQKINKFNKIIIINDGSTDGGDLVINKAYKENKLVEIYDQENLGSSEARNLGVKSSKADFIVFLDADDQLHPKYLVCLYLMLSKNPKSKIFSAKHHSIYYNTNLIRNTKDIKLLKTNIVTLNDPILNYSINQRIFCSSGICIQRELIEKNLFPKSINVGEDIYVWLKIFEKNSLTYYNTELIYIFKISENRSIELFKETPYYLKKINEFLSIKKISYKIYFFIASIVYLYQIYENNEKIKKKYFDMIEIQSLFYHYILRLFNNKIFFYFYKIFKKKKDTLIKVKENISTNNFLLIVSNYFFSLPSIPIVILTLYLTKKYELISELLIVSSLTILFTSSISFYARPFSIIKNKLKLSIFFLKLKKILFFPLLLGLCGIVYLLNINNFYTVFIGIFFILHIWKTEAQLTISELINSKKLLIQNLLKNVSITIILISTILIDVYYIKYFAVCYLVFLNLDSVFYQFKYSHLIKIIYSLKKYYKKDLFLISLNSITLNITNFLHRFLVIFYLEKSLAGIFLFIYSMGSFPATLFNYVFSTTIIRNKLKIPFILIFLAAGYFFLCVYFTYIYLFKLENSIILNFFKIDHLLYVIFSMIGGIIMSCAIFFKNKIFKKINSLVKILYSEFFYSVLVILLILFFGKFLHQSYFGYLFFCNSIIAIVVYTLVYKIK